MATDPFIAELRIFSWNYAPRAWAFANGQFLPINQNQALFSILGTTYGGNGQTTFALPDLRGRAPIHTGGGFTLGQSGGSASVTITQQTMPTHLHLMQASTANGDTNVFAGNVLAAAPIYGPPQNLTTLEPTSITNVGGSQPHTNVQPYLVLSICICLQGLFPSQN
jgi:microcystin-dependent protein